MADDPHEAPARRPLPRGALDTGPDGDGTRPRRALMDILHALPVGVEIYDGDFNAVFFNKAADDLFLYKEQVVFHHDDWWELGFPDPKVRAVVIAEWEQVLAQARKVPGSVQSGEWDVRCRDGQQHNVRFRFCFLGDIYVFVLFDITEQRRLEAELRRLANVDPLTETFNRRRFVTEADAAFAAWRRNRRDFALLMLDIDHFKAVNDQHGHGIGDDVIRLVASRCQRAIREGDVLARMGGEEFAVLLPDTGEADARRVAARLTESISATPLAIDSLRLPVGVSIGGTTAGDADEDLDAVLRRADRALYAAKNAGRGRVMFYAVG
ncbi:hypothetical protein GCM10007301_21430 [Azorhizobium oxalatiphilum]|uniref:GGDEF domain-containing protein n=1 Tax=Azorhizobium oxalatiphilum TaxID=980631 RepID=A0A917FAT4_9HYPH|nr:sensor domain-containing diguanylate cyclase [Azorhizobium oxalatiphilum]GGF61378.1 hypothetical protein GCM10007301_21430 [Azorhizobium oxalatiphilum]